MVKYLIYLLKKIYQILKIIVYVSFSLLEILFMYYFLSLVKFKKRFNSCYLYLKYDFFKFELKNELRSVAVSKKIIKEAIETGELQYLLSLRYNNYKMGLKETFSLKWFFKYILIICIFTMFTALLMNTDDTFIYTFVVDTTLDYPDDPGGLENWWDFDRWNIGDTYNTPGKFEIPYTQGLIDLEDELFNDIDLLHYSSIIFEFDDAKDEPFPKKFLEFVNTEFQAAQQELNSRLKTVLNFNNEYDLYIEYSNNKELFYLIRVLMVIKILKVLIACNLVLLIFLLLAIVIYGNMQIKKMENKKKNKY